MHTEWVRNYCLSLPHTTESIQWGNNLLFKIGGRMYAIVATEPSDRWISFKASGEAFAELVERPGIVPAPYLARASWVALETNTEQPRAELKALLRSAYELVLAKLPKKTRQNLGC